ncbi:hypothetical protein AB1Y20_019499 [Prymnesium parvum]|uniref:DNA replication complex GINS protein PSF1 n=1 Tax=Prymnesium parvum TaxID=97485 RepID=A0AB34JRY7_PRYPA
MSAGPCQHSVEVVSLLHELKSAFWLPPYATERVRAVIEKMAALYGESTAIQKLPGVDLSTKEGSMPPLVYLLTMMRNRDCLVCYVRTRMQRIEDMRWDAAGSLGAEELELLSVHERRYAQEFNNLLSAYQTENDLDLTRDYDPPSDNLYIRVNVLQDIGQFVGPESGVNIDLKRGDLSYLRRGDVEHLVRQGAVAQVV